MADTLNQTQIAQHLNRINTASNIIAAKAALMQLQTPDEELITNDSLIDRVADAIENIEIRKQSDLSLSQSGSEVIVPFGYYPDGVRKSATKADRAQTTIAVTQGDNANELDITADNPQQSGFVTKDTTKDTASVTASLSISGKTSTVTVGDKTLTDSVEDGSYMADIALTAGAGNAHAVGMNGVTLTKKDSEPTDGSFYIKATGSGTVSAVASAIVDKTGYVEMGGKTDTDEKTSNTAQAFFQLPSSDANGKKINPLTEDSITITEGYTKAGTISLTDDLLNLLVTI